MATIHIIGAGLSGLACAVRLIGRGRHIAVYEAAPQAGGRCRSFYDPALGRVIDNGNHLMMSANRALLDYLARIDAEDRLTGPTKAAYPFVDLNSGRRWVLRPNAGVLPWWLLIPSRRIPGSRLRDFLGSGWRLLTADADSTVAACIPPHHPLYRDFWEPLTLAALNCDPAIAAAQPLKAVMMETFARGAAYCRPLVARDGLGAALIEPALTLLARHGARPAFGQRLRALVFGKADDGGERVTALDFGTLIEPVAADDVVVLALPPTQTGELLPGQTVPEDGHVIVNAHFRLDQPPPPLPENLPFLGVIGGAAHWVFVHDDIVSVTVSGAGVMAEQSAETVADLLWHDVTRALALNSFTLRPPTRIIKEKRATFVQSPANQHRRPGSQSRWRNLLLAGDWTATGLPCTIEGAIRSGFAAARVISESG